MRILNIGDFDWMTGRERTTANLDLFAIRGKLTRAAVRAGHFVMEFSDRATARIRAPLGVRRLGRLEADRAFLQVVEELKPELILLNFADEISNAAIASARAISPGVMVADICIDPLPSGRAAARLTARKDAVDATFVTTAGPALKRFAGARGFAAFMPNPVDAAVEAGRAFETADPCADLVLPAGDDDLRAVGGARMPGSHVLAAIRAANLGLRVVAPGLDGPKVRGHAYLDLLAGARMGLSLSRFNDEPLYASDRMAHMLGMGLLTFIDARVGFQALYPSDAVAFYADLDDLCAQIARFAADDARLRETAARGRSRTFELFEAGRVFTYLLAQLDGGATGYEWPCERWTSG